MKVLHSGTPGTCIGGFYYWDTVEDIPNDDDILSGMPDGVAGVASFMTYPKQDNIRAFLNRELAEVVTTKLGDSYYHNVKYGPLRDKIRKAQRKTFQSLIDNGEELAKLRGSSELRVGDHVAYIGGNRKGDDYWWQYLVLYHTAKVTKVTPSGSIYWSHSSSPRNDYIHQKGHFVLLTTDEELQKVKDSLNDGR